MTRSIPTPLFLVALLAAYPAGANAQVTCGSTLGPGGKFTLTQDLDCNQDPACAAPGSCAAAITLVGNAQLDLAGHSIGCKSFDDDGIVLTGARAQVRNGNVRTCARGVVLGGEGRHVVRKISAVGNRNGFHIASDGNLLKENVADLNLNNGFNAVAGTGNKLVGNVATRSVNFNGFNFSGVVDASTFEANLAAANGGDGFNVPSGGHALTRNVAVGNGSDGFAFDEDGNTLVNNRADSNDQIGINVNGQGNRITGNSSLHNRLLDLSDADPACGSNQWKNNLFSADSADADCIE